MNDINSKKLEYLLSAYSELRNELKMRISQRDNFAIQFIAAVGVILSITVSIENKDSDFLIFLIPVATIFFSVQIQSSYSVHDRLALFIRDHIEKELGRILAVDELEKLFWENYCKYDRLIHNVKLPGIRKSFFIKAMFISPIISSIIFIIKRYSLPNHSIVDIVYIPTVISAIFILLSTYIYYLFEIRPKNIELQHFSSISYKRRNTRKSDKAVFFDRDGTIHVDKVMTRKKKDLEFFDDTFSTIQYFQSLGYKIIIITNQSGIAKGIYKTNEMKNFNNYMIKQLEKNNCFIDAIYFCPHKKEDNCICHKPKIGMIKRAQKEFNLDLSKCLLVGDKISDILCGINAGIPRNYLVTTGIYKNNDYTTEPNFFELCDKFQVISSLSEMK